MFYAATQLCLIKCPELKIEGSPSVQYLRVSPAFMYVLQRYNKKEQYNVSSATALIGS